MIHKYTVSWLSGALVGMIVCQISLLSVRYATDRSVDINKNRFTSNGLNRRCEIFTTI